MEAETGTRGKGTEQGPGRNPSTHGQPALDKGAQTIRWGRGPPHHSPRMRTLSHPLLSPPHLPAQASPVLAAKPVSCSKTRRFYREIEDRGEKTQILSPAHQLRIWVSAQDMGPWGARSPGQVSRPFLTPQGITSEQSV